MFDRKVARPAGGNKQAKSNGNIDLKKSKKSTVHRKSKQLNNYAIYSIKQSVYHLKPI